MECKVWSVECESVQCQSVEGKVESVGSVRGVKCGV